MFFYRKIGKRIFDLLVSIFLLILAMPLLLIIYLLIYLKLGRPCLFKQERPGYLGKIFTIYKFRTMKDAYDQNGKLLPDEARMTALGSFLRKMSLDELPELLNVIKGEMSLVGPRPLLVEYLPHYTHEQARRHLVKPGITGWAQIKGRNAISWDEKFKLDVWYVNKLNFLLDLKIILLTFYVTFRREGIQAEGHVTMPKFNNDSNF